MATLSCVQGNWAAALKLMAVDGLRAPPLTTPASFHVNYLRPVPSDEEVFVASTCENPVECSQVVPNSQRVQVEVRLRPHAARRQQRERERERVDRGSSHGRGRCARRYMHAREAARRPQLRGAAAFDSGRGPGRWLGCGAWVPPPPMGCPPADARQLHVLTMASRGGRRGPPAVHNLYKRPNSWSAGECSSRVCYQHGALHQDRAHARPALAVPPAAIMLPAAAAALYPFLFSILESRANPPPTPLTPQQS